MVAPRTNLARVTYRGLYPGVRGRNLREKRRAAGARLHCRAGLDTG